jgi:hypothetical protein
MVSIEAVRPWGERGAGRAAMAGGRRAGELPRQGSSAGMGGGGVCRGDGAARASRDAAAQGHSAARHGLLATLQGTWAAPVASSGCRGAHQSDVRGQGKGYTARTGVGQGTTIVGECGGSSM